MNQPNKKKIPFNEGLFNMPCFRFLLIRRISGLSIETFSKLLGLNKKTYYRCEQGLSCVLPLKKSDMAYALVPIDKTWIEKGTPKEAYFSKIDSLRLKIALQGIAITYIKRELELNQMQIAKKLGVTASYISKLEGIKKAPSEKLTKNILEIARQKIHDNSILAELEYYLLD